jgi:hypothetical protein
MVASIGMFVLAAISIRQQGLPARSSLGVEHSERVKPRRWRPSPHFGKNALIRNGWAIVTAYPDSGQE